MVILSAVGTCALRGGRSATNATNPGAAAASSTQPGGGEDMPGVEAGAAGSFPGQCLVSSILYIILDGK